MINDRTNVLLMMLMLSVEIIHLGDIHILVLVGSRVDGPSGLQFLLTHLVSTAIHVQTLNEEGTVIDIVSCNIRDR